ncbi:MAG TPA: hypothetical protein VKC89_03120 [Patescibacteria group bacterium]|nr:hypothetical protein [Patescibacteria group bacterium]
MSLELASTCRINLGGGAVMGVNRVLISISLSSDGKWYASAAPAPLP